MPAQHCQQLLHIQEEHKHHYPDPGNRLSSLHPSCCSTCRRHKTWGSLPRSGCFLLAGVVCPRSPETVSSALLRLKMWAAHTWTEPWRDREGFQRSAGTLKSRSCCHKCGGCQACQSPGDGALLRYHFISKLENQYVPSAFLHSHIACHPLTHLPPMPSCVVVPTYPMLFLTSGLSSDIPSALLTKGPVLGLEETLGHGCWPSHWDLRPLFFMWTRQAASVDLLAVL